MRPERWEQIDNLLQSALARVPRERSAFLAQACADDELLRREVESLIASHEDRSNFLETPMSAIAADLLINSQARLRADQKIGQYKIIDSLGAGGMGEVYLAEDTRLHRKVALKFLSTNFTQDHERLRRFEQEACAASALNHPNILTIHEIGEVESHHFIATEFIEGQTLRERLQSNLEIDEALEIGIQVASALVAAHRVNIVHRDIKPENIMIRDDGLVKVLDFGLAKMTVPRASIDSGAQTQLRANTTPGVVMGTVAYMSPEQARGGSVDERTDIWSLGVVLYEMVAGCSPFAASTSNEIISAILSKESPPPLTRYSHLVPERLEEIVEEALTKNRDERYQTSKDLLIDLKRLKQSLETKAAIERSTSRDKLEVPTSSAQVTDAKSLPPEGGAQNIHATSSAEYLINQLKSHKRGALITLVILALAALISIAVTGYFYLGRGPMLNSKDTVLLADFVNTTGDPNFDGTLRQALAVQLRQTPFLNLLPEEGIRETLRYMGRAEGERITPEIGREICRRRGLKAMLVGSIASLGRNYAITLEAINGQTGETIASQQIEAEGKEQVLKSLGQAALDLRKQLGESLSTLQKYNAPIEQATTSSLEALNIYSKGLEQIYRGDYKNALPLFNRAVELDPNFAEAYVWLAWTYSNFGDLAKTADFAAKAYALRNRVTELEKLHIDEIYNLYTTGNFEKQKEVDGLIKRLYPSDWLAPASLGYGYLRIGQLEQALIEFREALRLNPNESHLYIHASTILIRLNRFDEAREIIKQAQKHNLDHPVYRFNLYRIGLAQSDATETQQQLESIRKVDGESVALALERGAAVFSGHWRRVQELYNHAAALSRTTSSSRTNQILSVAAAIDGALFGFCQPATDDVRQALAISRISSPVNIMYVPVLANGSLCGDAGEAQKLADEQMRRYPNATLLNVYSEPIIRAAMTLQRDRPDQAVELLNASMAYDGGNAGFWPVYLRGQAYLRLRRGKEAAAAFQKILDHRGWDVLSPMYPLAQLGLGRALTISGDVNGSRKAYQDFFAIWKDADDDLPILLEAKEEYEKLNGPIRKRDPIAR
jgi:serine/threonine protein kinase/tetratricopeptide (TPR) repeat protein